MFVNFDNLNTYMTTTEQCDIQQAKSLSRINIYSLLNDENPDRKRVICCSDPMMTLNHLACSKYPRSVSMSSFNKMYPSVHQ